LAGLNKKTKDIFCLAGCFIICSPAKALAAAGLPGPMSVSFLT